MTAPRQGLTAEEVITHQPFWIGAEFTAVRKEVHGSRSYLVFTRKKGADVSILQRDMFTYQKGAPLIWEATGFHIEKVDAQNWHRLMNNLSLMAGEEIILSTETEEMQDLMRTWLDWPGTKTREITNVETEDETITGLANQMHIGKLDALYDGKSLMFRLPSLVTYVRRESQGFSRSDITRVLGQMHYKRKAISGRRIWKGPMI